MYIDIREPQAGIDGIKFDSSKDYIYELDGAIRIFSNHMNQSTELVNVKDIDNLIEALKKAKEIWG